MSSQRIPGRRRASSSWHVQARRRRLRPRSAPVRLRVLGRARREARALMAAGRPIEAGARPRRPDRPERARATSTLALVARLRTCSGRCDRPADAEAVLRHRRARPARLAQSRPLAARSWTRATTPAQRAQRHARTRAAARPLTRRPLRLRAGRSARGAGDWRRRSRPIAARPSAARARAAIAMAEALAVCGRRDEARRRRAALGARLPAPPRRRRRRSPHWLAGQPARGHLRGRARVRRRDRRPGLGRLRPPARPRLALPRRHRRGAALVSRELRAAARERPDRDAPQRARRASPRPRPRRATPPTPRRRSANLTACPTPAAAAPAKSSAWPAPGPPTSSGDRARAVAIADPRPRRRRDARRRRLRRPRPRRARPPRNGSHSDACPRATRSTTRPTASARCWRATCPTRSRRRTRASARDRWPRAARGPRGAVGRRPRQAPVPALRGRADDPLAPAHDGHVARPRRRDWRAPARALARASARGDTTRRPVQRAGARADDRRPHALRPAASRGSGPTSSRRTSTSRRFLRRLRDDDPTRPIGDALLDQRIDRRDRQRVEGRGLLRGRDRPVAARPATSPTRRRWRSSDAPGRGCSESARDGMQDRFERVYGRAGRPCPRCGGREHPRARAGRRQPHDLLVPAMPAVRARSATRAPT